MLESNVDPAPSRLKLFSRIQQTRPPAHQPTALSTLSRRRIADPTVRVLAAVPPPVRRRVGRRLLGVEVRTLLRDSGRRHRGCLSQTVFIQRHSLVPPCSCSHRCLEDVGRQESEDADRVDENDGESSTAEVADVAAWLLMSGWGRSKGRKGRADGRTVGTGTSRVQSRVVRAREWRWVERVEPLVGRHRVLAREVDLEGRAESGTLLAHVGQESLAILRSSSYEIHRVAVGSAELDVLAGIEEAGLELVRHEDVDLLDGRLLVGRSADGLGGDNREELGLARRAGEGAVERPEVVPAGRT